MPSDGTIKTSTDALNQLKVSSDSTLSSINQLNAALMSGDAFGVFANAAEAATEMTTGFSEVFKKIGGAIPGLGVALSGIGTALGGVSTAFGVVKNTMDVAKSAVDGFDAMSATFRQLDSSVYKTMTGFGMTYNEAVKLSTGIVDLGQNMRGEDFGFQNVSDVRDAYMKLAGIGIPIEQLSSKIETSAGSFKFYEVAILQAKAAGMDMDKYVSLIGNAIRTQGLSVQEASEQIAMFSDIAKNTGLSVDEVSTSLQNVASNYAKVGISANFSRPLLEGYARTMKSMGLGIKESIDLSQSLTKSLASIPTNYSTAYITAQRGGMNLPGQAGGGVLNAGIQMQARMLRAQRGEGGESQENIAKEMALAMKDTIASFSGGRVVTLEDAAKDTSLQQSFAVQTDMLKSMYGMDDDSAIRTLDLLSNLETAMASGDEDLSNKLGAQLRDSVDAQNGTKSTMEKLNATAYAQLAQSLVQTRVLSDQLVVSGSLFAAMTGNTVNNLLKPDSVGKMSKTAAEAVEKFSSNYDKNDTLDGAMEEGIRGIDSLWESMFGKPPPSDDSESGPGSGDGASKTSGDTDIFALLRRVATSVDGLTAELKGKRSIADGQSSIDPTGNHASPKTAGR